MKHEIKLFIINNPHMTQKQIAFEFSTSIPWVNRIYRELIPQKAIGGK